MSRENQIKRDIQKDMDEIQSLLEQNNSTEDELLKLHIKIDGKYQSKINNWGHSCYNWDDKNGFSYNYIDISSLKHNLLNMKSKLEGYWQAFTLAPIAPSNSKTVNYINNNTNTNSNKNDNSNININEVKIDFKQIEKTINDMESLTSAETKEALEKLKELENIYNSKGSRKTKWETAKKILIWVADKSVDVAIAYFPVIMSILNK